MLGYVSDKQKRCETRPLEGQIRFELALANLRIEPFTHESVQEYQARVCAERTETTRRNAQRDLQQGRLLMIFGIAWGLIVSILHDSQLAYIGSLLDIAGIWSMISTITTCHLAQRRNEWERISLKSAYNAPVPPFILRQAVLIKKMLPEADFEVVELKADTPSHFLLVIYEGEIAWIDLWRESEYNDKGAL